MNLKQTTNSLFLLIIFSAVLACKDTTDLPTNIAGRDDNLALGNPSNALADVGNPNNYLMTKPQFVLSYNRDKKIANWVSWHLSKAWKGDAVRKDDFRADDLLPSSWSKVVGNGYSNSGFDRGHLCPSDDRDGSQTDNSATFLMTNIIPQAPENNRETWRILEEYCRSLANKDMEMYIIAGGYGTGGIGSNTSGGLTRTINDGISVPNRLWKIILVLPNGSKDISRITSSTRVIAVDMPNTQNVTDRKWYQYRVSVREIESKTGYNFFSTLPINVQNVIETTIDTEKIE
jgi:endonuclease G